MAKTIFNYCIVIFFGLLACYYISKTTHENNVLRKANDSLNKVQCEHLIYLNSQDSIIDTIKKENRYFRNIYYRHKK